MMKLSLQFSPYNTSVADSITLLHYNPHLQINFKSNHQLANKTANHLINLLTAKWNLNKYSKQINLYHNNEIISPNLNISLLYKNTESLHLYYNLVNSNRKIEDITKPNSINSHHDSCNETDTKDDLKVSSPRLQSNSLPGNIRISSTFQLTSPSKQMNCIPSNNCTASQVISPFKLERKRRLLDEMFQLTSNYNHNHHSKASNTQPPSKMKSTGKRPSKKAKQSCNKENREPNGSSGALPDEDSFVQGLADEIEQQFSIDNNLSLYTNNLSNDVSAPTLAVFDAELEEFYESNIFLPNNIDSYNSINGL
jgi:hypothetical protein